MASIQIGLSYCSCEREPPRDNPVASIHFVLSYCSCEREPTGQARGIFHDRLVGAHDMKIVLRGLIGLVIGICYGVVIWIITSYTYMIGVDREHPGPMIPDAVGMARLLALLAGLVTGTCAAVAGLVVGLAALKPRKAALVAGSIGLLVQVLLMLPSLDSSVVRAPRFFLREQLLGLVLLPLGVGVVGLLVSVVVRILKLSQQ